MEGLYIQPPGEDGVIMGKESVQKGEQEEGRVKASSPTNSVTEEETDEDSEPEPPQVSRRKVSFADAFGFNLVSVKEFDNVEARESEVIQPPENKATHPVEEFYMSCLFTVPSSPEELDQRLQAQMVELESIELLPGTTTLRGIIRVVNLCYSKSVYARVTLDRWTSYFELLAEYVPGSSDRKTDRFTFNYTLVPPFEREGTRVEVCLRYETSLGTFWANNNEMNYVLFCHKKGHVKEHVPQVQEESTSCKSKRSCLKANRRGSAEEKTGETNNPLPAAAEAEATHEAEEANRKNSTDIQSLLYQEEHTPLVDSIKNRHRAAHLAPVQDYLSHRRQQIPKAYSHDSPSGQKVSQPLPTPWADSTIFLHKRQKKQSNENPQVLTYHQIPLLTLDWNNDQAHQWEPADMDDLWVGGAEMTMSKASEEKTESTLPVSDMWGTFCNGTDDTTDKETSVCDVWQEFLNGPSCADHSGVPESEWLQTAASVSPSNDKEPIAQYAASSQEPEFQVGTDTAATLHAHTSALCQLLSDTCEISLANVASNTEEQQPAEACVNGPGGDNTGPQDASQRSQTNSVTDTRQECCLKGATPVSLGSVDGSTEYQRRAIRETERDGITGRAEGIGRDEPFTLHTADLVTSSGEPETTDMTATAESQNATAVDRISQGARLDEDLSSGRDEEVTGSAHNVMDDMLAFRGTVRKGMGGERFVFSTSRQEVQEGIVNNCTEKKVSTDEEIFRPQETAQCEISQRYADEKQHEQFKLNRNSGNPLQENESDENEIRLVKTNADKSNPSQVSEENFKQSQVMTSTFKWEESQNEDVASDSRELKEKTEVEPKKRLIGAQVGTIQVLNEEVHCKQSRPIRAEEEEDSTVTQIQENIVTSETSEHVLIPNEEGRGLSCDGIIEEKQEINSPLQTRHTVEMKKVCQCDQDTLRPLPADVCNPKPVEEVEMRWNHLQDNRKGQREDGGCEISPEEVKAEDAKRDISTELQHQTETLGRAEEDERVSTGKLGKEVLGELMGNVENPQGENGNAPARLKEQQSSAEVESSPQVEYKKLSERTKDPITAENTVALEVMESGREETFIERFGEDLVRRIWEEVFGLKEQAFNRDTDTANGRGGKLADIPDITQEHHLLFEKDFNDDFDSGVFSLTELPTDPNLATNSSEYSPKETSRSLATAEQTHFPADSNSSAYLGQHFTPILAAQSRQSSTESAESSPETQEIYAQTRERSVTCQETSRQTEECVVAHGESLNRSAHPSHKHPSSSSDKLKECDGVVWWSVLYILSHITRLLICTLLVAGFFFIVFLYDFPALFALYMFSLCWWFYKWKRHHVTTNKGVAG